MTIPKLAEILGVSVEELLQAPANKPVANPKINPIIDIVLKAVPLAMGVVIVVTSVLGQLDAVSGFTMLGIGMGCIGIYLLKNKE